MNMDLTVVERSGYTIVDFLSDIGGLQSIMITVISFWLSIWNYNYLENHLVARLYTA